MWKVVPIMIWFIWIIDIVLGFFPVIRDHFVQHLALCPVAEDMLAYIGALKLGFFPQFLGPSWPWSYPQPIVEPEEPAYNWFRSLATSSSQWKLCNATNLLVRLCRFFGAQELEFSEIEWNLSKSKSTPNRCVFYLHIKLILNMIWSVRHNGIIMLVLPATSPHHPTNRHMIFIVWGAANGHMMGN